jgi:hypothetical protein
MTQLRVVRVLAMAAVAGACASFAMQRGGSVASVSPEQRLAAIHRAQVWAQTDVPAMDLKTGPRGPDAFALGETVTCDYVDRKLHGNSPKFACAIGGDHTEGADEVKVKFGAANGEVYGEVAATRLLWALGFGADRMYPVRVVCRGCPPALKGASKTDSGDTVFDPAVIERKARGHEIESAPYQGWSWDELDLVDTDAGGAPVAQRDALKLLAVLIQHGDNKPEQQMLVCRDKGISADGVFCEQPFMFISDLGLTFGRSDWINRNAKEGVNLARWADTPVWKKSTDCVGNLSKSLTGSLGDPVISEAGRQFLADLLVQLSDAQLHDLFDAAQVARRPSAPDRAGSAPPSIDEWVSAFRHKRDDIVSRRCAPAQPARSGASPT